MSIVSLIQRTFPEKTIRIFGGRQYQMLKVLSWMDPRQVRWPTCRSSII